MLAAIGRPRDDDLIVDLLDLDVAVTRSDSSPLGPFTVTRSGSIETVTPAGTGMGCLPMRDMARSTVYQTRATTSPPTPSLRASWPVMSPLEVEMIAVPMPPWIRGMWAWST